MMPGMMPPRKSLPIETPMLTPSTTMTMLGGMIVPSEPAHPRRAALKGGR